MFKTLPLDFKGFKVMVLYVIFILFFYKRSCILFSRRQRIFVRYRDSSFALKINYANQYMHFFSLKKSIRSECFLPNKMDSFSSLLVHKTKWVKLGLQRALWDVRGK